MFADAQGQIFSTHADGKGVHPQPLTSEPRIAPWSFTRDGKRIAVHRLQEEQFDIWTVGVTAEGTKLRAGAAEPFFQTPFNERAPDFSPNGRWIAYESDESGRYQINVCGYPFKQDCQQVSIDGGHIPTWSPTGRELFFVAADGQIMVTTYTLTGSSITAQRPRVWLQKRLNPRSGRTYDVAADGKHMSHWFLWGMSNRPIK